MLNTTKLPRKQRHMKRSGKEQRRRKRRGRRGGGEVEERWRRAERIKTKTI
jgi:hypothetical protein